MADTDSADQTKLTVRTPDDRDLDVLTIGPADGLPLVFHIGTPGGIAVYPPMIEAAGARGLRVVLYCRPGYGGSTPSPGRPVAQAATDVAAIMSALGASEFITAGWSGGGPHALACACLLPDQCRAAATLAGVAPYGPADLDWLGGMAADGVAEFDAALGGEQKLTELLTAVGTLMQGLTGTQLVEGIGDLASAADKAALTSELADYVAATFQQGLAPGTDGWRDDDLALVSDWGFAVDTAGAAPVSIWQGDQDLMVPYGHGQWLAAHIPAARAHFTPGTGHMYLPFAEVFDELLERAGRR